MAPVIRISEENYARLKLWAEPLEDTVDSALGKILDAAETNRDVGGRHRAYPTQPENPAERESAPKDRHSIPQEEYRLPLLVTLYRMGGSAGTKAVRSALLDEFADRLSPFDREIVGSNQQRWWNRVCWERNALVKAGLLKDDSPHGVWELSQAGTDFVQEDRVA